MFDEESWDIYASAKDSSMSAEERLAAKLSELKTLLPPAPEPKGVYRPVVIVDKLVYTSGHLPVRPSGELVTGRLGADLTVEAGYEAARLVGLGILASLRQAVRHAGPDSPRGEGFGRGQQHGGIHASARGDQRLQRAFRADLRRRRGHRGPQRPCRPHAAFWAWPWRSRRFSSWRREPLEVASPRRADPFQVPHLVERVQAHDGAVDFQP